MASLNVPIATWHRRLGHSHAKVLKIILNKFSFPTLAQENFNFCNSYLSNKAHQQPFVRFTLSSSKRLQMIFSDLWGPSPFLSLDKKLYYCIFVDQYMKYIWLYILKQKSDIKKVFQKFHSLVEKYFNDKILSFYTNGGGKFKSLDSYLNSNGI